MSDHEADDPALAGFITLQKERLQSLTRLQQNYKKESASRKTECYYMKRLQQIESLNAAFETTPQGISASWSRLRYSSISFDGR